MLRTTLVKDTLRDEDSLRPGTLSKAVYGADIAEPRLTKRDRILVVEDNVDVAKSIALRLKALGYEVQIAGDGIEATKVAIHTVPDLILLDIGLPCGDGHEVAARLQMDCRTMTIPVIYLTARTSDDDQMRAAANGAFGYITKPFRSDQLAETIAKALSQNHR
ncbi:MAG: hypothetical protein QOJ65_2290 [Fimbriimonadaceae bacterium]|jgi:CheY-like chemotaxis protein|nr:hypothetical protein [Fimbriimonadaceae bacterium]